MDSRVALHYENGNFWCVVLHTHDSSGAPYPNIYRHIPGGTREEAIDYALERCVGVYAGRPALIDGWRVERAWAVEEKYIGDDIPIRPISQPAFERYTPTW